MFLCLFSGGVYDDRGKNEESCEWFDVFGDEKNEK